jgi:hypothetical protein
VGFYAESLILLGLTVSSSESDALLADALLLCARHGLGMPPSLNGGNAEAQTRPYRVPRSAQANIVVANLSRLERAACLVVNAGQHVVKLDAALYAVPDGWAIPEGELPPGGWLRIEA